MFPSPWVLHQYIYLGMRETGAVVHTPFVTHGWQLSPRKNLWLGKKVFTLQHHARPLALRLEYWSLWLRKSGRNSKVSCDMFMTKRQVERGGFHENSVKNKSNCLYAHVLIVMMKISYKAPFPNGLQHFTQNITHYDQKNSITRFFII